MAIPRIFISYARSDEHFVRRLCRDLGQRRVKYWLDVKDIQAGDSIVQKIEGALTTVDVFALCLSKASVARPWVQREYGAALAHQLSSQDGRPRVIPVLIEDCSIPPLLLDVKFADFRQNYDEGLKVLL